MFIQVTMVVEKGFKPLTHSLAYHTCFYTSNLNAFYYAIHFIGAGVGHLLFKILWSELFHYHIRNVATQEPYCTTTQTHLQLHCGLAQCLRVLIIISNLGISSIVYTPFMKMLNPYISVVCDCYQ